jgi:histone arginine demethylase JMJD6
MSTLYSENIKTIKYSEYDEARFISEIEEKHIPCKIEGVTDDWNVPDYWTWEAIAQNYGEAKMKIAESDSGKKVRVSMKEFIHYVVTQRDDNPLYLFESEFAQPDTTQCMLERYKTPKYFRQDYFADLTGKRRPPFRWFLIGPKRSGSSLHIDPLLTSAWNANLQGHKLWVMWPNEFPKWIVNGENKRYTDKGKLENDAVEYFSMFLPQILETEPEAREKMVSCIQYPGDTMFVPGGWWHAV